MKLRLLLWLLAILLIGGFSRAGVWQWGRALEKETLIADSARVLRERRPQSLSKLSREPAPGLAWVSGFGHFKPGPALLLDNQRRGAAVGVSEFRVFIPEDGRALLVDLGWRPLPADRTLPQSEAITGRQSLRGLLLPPPSPGLALGPAHAVSDRDRWLLTRIDIADLSQALRQPLGPRVFRLDPAIAIGYTRDLNIMPNTLPPERHRGYALQWFGLAAVTLVFALFQQFRAHRR